MRLAVFLTVLLWGATAAVAQLEPIATTSFVAVVDGQARHVHEMTVECTEAHRGRNNISVSDPTSKRTFQVEVNCQPPRDVYQLTKLAEVARDVYTARYTTCLTTQLTVPNGTRAEFQAWRGERQRERHRAAATMALESNRYRQRSRAQPQEVVAGLVAGAVGAAVYCGITGCGGDSGELADAIAKVNADLERAMNDIASFESQQNRLNAQTSRFLQRIDDRQAQIAQGVERNAEDIRALSGGVQALTAFETQFAETATFKMNQLVSALNATVDQNAAIDVQMLNLHRQAQAEIQTALKASLTNARRAAALEAQVYRMRMNVEGRREATARYYEAVANPPGGAIATTPFVQDYQFAPPKTEVELNTQVRTLEGSVVIATASVQGTVDNGAGGRVATQLDFELRVDPYWFATRGFVPGAGLNEILTSIGGDRPGGGLCDTPPVVTNGSEPLWNCRAILVVTGTACTISSPSVFFPWDFDGAADGGINLRADRLEGFLPPECSGFAPTSYGGITTPPISYYMRASDFYTAMEDACAAPNGGSWIPYSAAGAGGVQNPRVRVARMDSTNVMDMTLDTSNFTEVCNADVNAFQRNDRNMERMAYVVWQNLRASWSQSGTWNMAEREVELFGRLPGNLTYQHDYFSLDPVTDAQQRCDTVVVPFVRNTGSLDEDVLSLYQWERAESTRAGGSVRVYDDTGLVTPSTVFGDVTAGKAPLPRNDDGAYEFAVESSLSDLNRALQPEGELILEHPSWWGARGLVFDLDPRDLSATPSANARRGTASYILRRRHLNGTTGVLSAAKSQATLSGQVWLDQNLAFFHADALGDSPQMYARFYDQAQGCGNAQQRETGLDTGTAQPNKRLCNLLDAYEVVAGTSDRVTLVPRNSGWSSRMTFRVPGGVFRVSRATACPLISVDYSGGRALVTLSAERGTTAPSEICAVVVGVADVLQEALTPTCTRAVQGATVPAFGQGTAALDPIHDATASGCVAQYLRVYPLPEGYSTCPPSATLLAGTIGDQVSCFQSAMGLSLQTSETSVPDDTYTGTASSAHVRRVVDQTAETLRRIANATDADEARIQQAILRVGVEGSAVEAEIQRLLQRERDIVNNLEPIDAGLIARASEELTKREDRIAAKIDSETQKTLDGMAAVIAQARTDEETVNRTFSEAIKSMQAEIDDLRAAIAQFRNDSAAEVDAANRLDDGEGIFSGLIGLGGFVKDLAEDILKSPLAFIWHLIVGLFNFLLPFLLLFLLIYCCAPEAVQLLCSCGKSAVDGAVGGRVAFSSVPGEDDDGSEF